MRLTCLIAILLVANHASLGQINHQLKSAGLKRDYIIFAPVGCQDRNCPVVIVLHGGGGNNHQVMRFTNFNSLATKESFIAVYPNGLNKSWNDGRISPKKGSYVHHIDDVKFISDLIDTVCTNYHGDVHNVFATGISNGGVMAIYLAYKLSEKVKAVAPVAASLPENLEAEFKPSGKVAVLITNGTADKLIPYLGGPVIREEAGRGSIIATEKMFSIWAVNNGHKGEPRRESLPNKDLKDGCEVEKISYENDVVLLRINGGGHTWPGGSQYLPKSVVGNVCRDFSATEMIWAFFKAHIQ